jgi:hypothetical protein
MHQRADQQKFLFRMEPHRGTAALQKLSGNAGCKALYGYVEKLA